MSCHEMILILIASRMLGQLRPQYAGDCFRYQGRRQSVSKVVFTINIFSYVPLNPMAKLLRLLLRNIWKILLLFFTPSQKGRGVKLGETDKLKGTDSNVTFLHFWINQAEICSGDFLFHF